MTASLHRARENLQLFHSVGTRIGSRAFYRELEQVVDLIRAALHCEIYMLFTSGQQQRETGPLLHFKTQRFLY